ncbi:hypothetical protein RFI_33680 [Reticulomyxa filosa]|uniref:Uncharacterized protein n=1 Tax=Reticulomyxa filosa TaxID=46433 RepID=X6LRF1_RETFI|nr:hypothetical protein RFI_33680 [Reticulomyxa filosa]|eukprot:ETO03722.1 hypothetical protein RFI_33680 [Reticulomyxa filosa]
MSPPHSSQNAASKANTKAKAKAKTKTKTKTKKKRFGTWICCCFGARTGNKDHMERLDASEDRDEDDEDEHKNEEEEERHGLRVNHDNKQSHSHPKGHQHTHAHQYTKSPPQKVAKYHPPNFNANDNHNTTELVRKTATSQVSNRQFDVV